MKNDKSRSLVWMILSVAACGGGGTVGEALDHESQAHETGDRGDDHGDHGEGEAAWPQWAQNERHTGAIRTVAQPLRREYANIVYDPLARQAVDATGALLIHYQVPLVDGKDVFMEEKDGTYDPTSFDTQVWREARFRWVGDTLTKQWQFQSDWRPPGRPQDFWEPVFHAVLANDRVYVPGAGGTIIEVDRRTGHHVGRINPHGNTVDPNKYTVSPITADDDGNLYYNAIELPAGAVPGFYQTDAVDSWLVKVTPRGKTSKVSYKTLVPDAPSPTAVCEIGFVDPTTRPWPPPAGTPQATTPCGTIRPGLNIAPAVAADGTIYTAAVAHFANRYSYLVAVKPNLKPKWAASLRDRFTDGCGVPISQGGTMPPNGAFPGCREGAPLGVDPQTGRKGDGRVTDSSSATPAIAPDGSIFFGTFTAYNGFRGHTVRFSPSGQYLGAYPFGWDSTPAIYRHDATYSVITKDNYYIDFGPDSPVAFYVTQLSPSFDIEWRFKNTNTESCRREANGEITCVSDHPDSFEWCMNAPAVDKKGNVYAISEDGWLYGIKQGGAQRDRIFQELALGAAYTPASIGGDGKVYSQNVGHMFVSGK